MCQRYDLPKSTSASATCIEPAIACFQQRIGSMKSWTVSGQAWLMLLSTQLPQLLCACRNESKIILRYWALMGCDKSLVYALSNPLGAPQKPLRAFSQIGSWETWAGWSQHDDSWHSMCLCSERCFWRKNKPTNTIAPKTRLPHSGSKPCFSSKLFKQQSVPFGRQEKHWCKRPNSPSKHPHPGKATPKSHVFHQPSWLPTCCQRSHWSRNRRARLL